MIGNINNSNSLNSLRHISSNDRKTDKLYRQMSSGSRIPQFSFDPAGGAISEKMRAQFEQYERQIMNEQDTVNRLNTEEGAYDGIGSSMQEIRKLQIQARNDTLSDQDREHIQNEIDLQIESMKFMADSAEFNTKKVVQPGEELQKIFDEGVDATGDLIDDAINEVSSRRSEIGAKVNSTTKQIDEKMIAYENTVASFSGINDMDMAKGMVEKIKLDMMKQAGTANLKNIMNTNRDSIRNIM
ncbi:MAG: flagellin [Candidatus Muiribacteriaceae bacterium]